MLSRPWKRDQIYEIAFEDLVICFLRCCVCWFVQGGRGTGKSVKSIVTCVLLVHKIRNVKRYLYPSHFSSFPPALSSSPAALSLTSPKVRLPTSLPTFHGANVCPLANISSTSSNVLPTVSGNMKSICKNAAKLNVPKMKYVFHAMLLRPGGTANASAVLNAQFVAVARETAFPRVLREYSSAGYVHETGPMVMAKLQTKK